MERVSLQPFQLSPAESVGPRWERWVARFENYLVATKIEDDDRKRAQLLHVGGSDVFDVFLGLATQPTSYDETKEALDNHFAPKRNR